MPTKWEDYTGEGPADPHQAEPEKKSAGSLDPKITAALILGGAIIVAALLFRGAQPADELAYAWLPAEQIAPPAAAVPQAPKPIPRESQRQVRGGKLTYELDMPCAGKPRGQPFQCGSSSPTGWCFCRER